VPITSYFEFSAAPKLQVKNGRSILRSSSYRFGEPFWLCMRFDSSRFARSSSARRDALSPFPARLMKYVSIRSPDCGPFGDTFFDASDGAIERAFFLNNPAGG
jgi:hypothetical protein